MASPVALQHPNSGATDELEVQHVVSASSHHLNSCEGQTSSNATHTPRSSNPFVSTPWLSATQNIDDGTSLLPTPTPSLTTIGGTNRISTQPGQLDAGLNSGPLQTTSARSRPHNDPTAIPDINPQFPSGRRYHPTYQDPSIGLSPLVDMNGYGPPQRQQRIVPDLDALFDELASLDGAEKCVTPLTLILMNPTHMFCRADNLPEFMQNLGFVSDSTVPETYSFSSQMEPFLLSQTQHLPSASSPSAIRREPQTLGMLGTTKQ